MYADCVKLPESHVGRNSNILGKIPVIFQRHMLGKTWKKAQAAFHMMLKKRRARNV